ncbi:heavy metal-binding domain-containing protein [uncultured Flavobacterium sp.]|uniref:heavy metal-binding domain-containing protein n=1 Tax=uncultured Flavobacterium sp. TaxID=165435 RepID=UPI0030C8C4C9
MRKSILMFAFAIATMTFVSCKGEANEGTETNVEATDEHAGHNHEEGEMHMASYVCPMDCEKGKTYEVAGKCPVCEMDLVENTESHEGHDHEGHEGHNH